MQLTPTRRATLRTAFGPILIAAWPGRVRAAAARTYTVGSTATGVPFTFIDIKTSMLTGAMVDIMKAIARDAGFAIDLRVIGFGALIPSLTTRKIDIISAAMLKTPARTKVVDFSEPIYSYGGGIVVPAGVKKEYRNLADLRDLVVGVQVGTRFAEQLQAGGVKNVKIYENLMEMLGDLSVERIDAAYGDAPIFTYEIALAKIRTARMAEEFHPPSVEDVCLVVRKGDTELLDLLDVSIKRLKNTAIRAVLEHWGLR